MGKHSKKRKQKDRDPPQPVSSINIESLAGQFLSDHHYITLDGKRVAKLVEGDVNQCKLLALDKFGCFILAGHRVGVVQLLAPKPKVDEPVKIPKGPELQEMDHPALDALQAKLSEEEERLVGIAHRLEKKLDRVREKNKIYGQIKEISDSIMDIKAKDATNREGTTLFADFALSLARRSTKPGPSGSG